MKLIQSMIIETNCTIFTSFDILNDLLPEVEKFAETPELTAIFVSIMI